jgi:hypothetical protein
MSAPNDGGPAFPHAHEDYPFQHGMSLRDWFAGQAICGIIHSGYPLDSTGFPPAKYAYKLADAMLAERIKGGAE